MNSSFLKKNWYLLTPALILVIPALIILFFTVNYGYSFNDSFKAFCHFGSSSTRYSQGFSESKFSAVRVGMDGRQVYGIIKNPFERLNEDTEWRYALPNGQAKYYHERTIILEKDKNGVPRVKQRISRFHTPD